MTSAAPALPSSGKPAAILVKAAGGNHLRRALLAQLREAGSQTVAEFFPPHGEAGPDGAEEGVLVIHLPGQFLPHPEGDDSGGHLGLGHKAMGRHIKQQLRLCVILA